VQQPAGEQHDAAGQQADDGVRPPAPDRSLAQPQQDAGERGRQQHGAGDVEPALGPERRVAYEDQRRGQADDRHDGARVEEHVPGPRVHADQRSQEQAAADPGPVAGVDRADGEVRPARRHRVVGDRLGQGQHREQGAHQHAGDDEQREAARQRAEHAARQHEDQRDQDHRPFAIEVGQLRQHRERDGAGQQAGGDQPGGGSGRDVQLPADGRQQRDDADLEQLQGEAQEGERHHRRASVDRAAGLHVVAHPDRLSVV
jgi:hypothetical protein